MITLSQNVRGLERPGKEALGMFFSIIMAALRMKALQASEFSPSLLVFKKEICH
jgi:hypothetical protein